MSDKVWIGVDPGGKGNFGVAVLRSGKPAETWCVDCADEAVETIAQRLESAPAGVGIDAPMWWSSGLSGDRLADQWIRSQYGLSGGNVQTANSLRVRHSCRGRCLRTGCDSAIPKSTLRRVILKRSGLRWMSRTGPSSANNLVLQQTSRAIRNMSETQFSPRSVPVRGLKDAGRMT